MNIERASNPRLIACLALSLLAAAPLWAADDRYVGSQSCAGCHRAEIDAWRGSHHDLAMQPATDETVLGNFHDAEVTIHGLTSRFFMRDGRFFVNTDGPDGQMADFEIAYTFGFDPLQQYLVPFPDGRLQALSLAWDSRPAGQGGQRWFHLYSNEVIDHTDELHWTSRQQNWNYMCADCHSTNLVKGYEADTDRFATTWSEIDVACEACHGPGGSHAEWAGKNAAARADDAMMGLSVLLRDRQGARWQMESESGVARRSVPLERHVEVGVCADCHSRRGTIHGGGQANPDFLDQYVPAFLTESLYFPDGQIEDEVYVWGSFTQSRMYAAGVTCSDCHDPHSLKLRAEGDAVCAQCHLSTRFAVTAHHGHAGPAAPACVDCHMPQRTYMVVDPRRDHSIRIPRPQLTAKFGVPNACNQCHAGETVEWAVAAYDRLFPDAGMPYQDWTTAFDLARKGLPQAEVSLMRVARDDAGPDIVRATAIIELAPFLGPLSGQVLQNALKDGAPLVRLAALRTLDILSPEHRFAFAGHLLQDPALAIRAEVGRALAATPPDQLDAQSGAGLRSAIDEYVAAQHYNADRPESWFSLGNLHRRMNDLGEAEADYLHALRLAPDFGPAYLNLADLYRFQDREEAAADALEKGLARQPGDAALHHALGLSKIRREDREAALVSLGRAVELAPENARYAYVYGVALNALGQTARAIELLTAAQAYNPNDVQLMQTLALFERDRGNPAGARRWAEEILSRDPTDQGARQFLQSLPEDSN